MKPELQTEDARRLQVLPCVGQDCVSSESLGVSAAGTTAVRYVEEEAWGMWEMEEVEPWPERVDGPALLEELAGVMRRFVVLPKHAAEALALWVVHTYAFQLRDVSTYVGIESPEKRCGKTTLLTVLSELVNRPVVASNISSPAFFRVIEETRPTLLIDEADTFLQGNEELRGILNSGYSRKTAYVVRVAERTCESVRGGHGRRAGERGSLGEMTNSEFRVPNEKDERLGLLAPSLLTHEPPARSAHEGPLPGGKFLSHASQAAKVPGGGGEGETESQVPGFKSHVEEKPGDKLKLEHHTADKLKLELLAGEGTGHGAVSAPGNRVRRGSRLMRFSCWCPKVVAAIGRLPETLADRCIVIRMQRKTAKEECERLRYLEPVDLRRKCARFVRDHASAIAQARPVLPAALHDRAGDIWEPLLALADLAGGLWPEKARQAAVGLTSVAQESSPIGALLWDILMMFVKSGRDRLFSRWMVAGLNEMVDRPWAEVRKGKQVNELWLAQQLRPYGIKSKTMWIDGEAAKGYENEDFSEVFKRYIPRAEYEAFRLEQK